MQQEQLIKPTEEEASELKTEFYDHMRAIFQLDKARKAFLAENKTKRKEHQAKATHYHGVAGHGRGDSRAMTRTLTDTPRRRYQATRKEHGARTYVLTAKGRRYLDGTEAMLRSLQAQVDEEARRQRES